MSQIFIQTPTGGSSTVTTLTGNIGGAIAPVAGNINVVGTGAISVAGTGNTLTITDMGGPGLLPWTIVTAASATMVSNNGYIANNNGTCVLTLPVASAVGDVLTIKGMNNDLGWSIAQATGQAINIATTSTSMGPGGSLSSTGTRDCISMVCIITDTVWDVITMTGNITVI